MAVGGRHSIQQKGQVHLGHQRREFRTFIAASPSIWWDADAVLKDEAAFGRVVGEGKVSPRVLICVGADEPDSPNPPQALLDSLPAERKAELTAYLKIANRWSGMVSGPQNLAGRLEKLKGAPTYTVKFVAFAGEGHASSQLPALSRGVQFAFSQ